jgi:co-chaperonin GroES (HSP10)
MPYMKMNHEKNPKDTIFSEIGDLSSIKVFNNQVLVAIYKRPEKTKSGIVLTDNTRNEDKYQGKVGLVLKKGPLAFVDDEETWFKDVEINEGDWIFFRPSDGWQMNVHGVDCRVLRDIDIRGTIKEPDQVW